MREPPERELVAAADAELFELRVCREDGREVPLLDPGDLGLLHRDVAEEERPQAGQPVARADEGLDRRVGRRAAADVAPRADDERPDLLDPGLLDEGGKDVRPGALRLIFDRDAVGDSRVIAELVPFTIEMDLASGEVRLVVHGIPWDAQVTTASRPAWATRSSQA